MMLDVHKFDESFEVIQSEIDVVSNLRDWRVEDFYNYLGNWEHGPNQISSFYEAYPNKDYLTMSDLNSSLGKLIYKKCAGAAYDFFCKSNDEDENIKTKILGLITGSDGSAAALAAFLVAYLGIAPAVAAICAVLMLRIFINPTRIGLCEYWEKILNIKGGEA